MTRAVPWVHGELPWLSGPPDRVRRDAWSLVDELLRRWNYRRVALDGRAMTSKVDARAELHAAFGFPDWCGHNWDAFNDYFGDFVEQRHGANIAVVWRDLDLAARQAPATTAEVGWGLLDCAFGSMPSVAPGTEWSVKLGHLCRWGGPDFCAPAEVHSRRAPNVIPPRARTSARRVVLQTGTAGTPALGGL